jgi:hypothetical protein
MARAMLRVNSSTGANASAEVMLETSTHCTPAMSTGA